TPITLASPNLWIRACRSKIAQEQSRRSIGCNHTPRTAPGKRTARKAWRLKNTFPDGDGIAGLDAKTSAAALIEFLGIYLEDLVAVRTLSPHGYSFRRSDTRISACQCDRFQQIDTARAGLGHFITAWATDLPQNREPPLGIAKQHHIYFGVHQIIAAVQLSKFRSGLSQR